MTDALVQCRDVTFHYDRRRPVLRGLDFVLSTGERVALVGPNGSGKTTLFHLLVGLLLPTGGTIEAFGRPRRQETDFLEVRQRIGMVFQSAEDQLFCPTVAEDVAFGPLNLGRSRDEATEIVGRTLDSLGLSGYEDRITHRLSGGEQRLVSLATVLAMDPDVLLLDEPTAGLDDASTARLQGIIAKLPQAMLVVSHDHSFLAATTQHEACLRNGRLATASTDGE
jgi:cobalt/nickel transport system ATP-binding protein